MRPVRRPPTPPVQVKRSVKKISQVRPRAYAGPRLGPEDDSAPTEVVHDRVLQLADLERKARELENESYFDTLRVPRDADERTIEIAFHKQIYIWHPARLPPSLSAAQPLAAAICSRIAEARRMLRDPVARASYVRVLLEQEQRDTASLIERADTAIQRQELNHAEELLMQAIKIDGEQPRYMARLAWVQAEKMGPMVQPRQGRASSRYDAQLGMLDRAIRRDPHCEKSRLIRGELLKRSGYLEDAIHDYRMAVMLNPHNVSAAREVHAYEMQKLHAEKRGLLQRMLGKKEQQVPRRKSR